MDISEILLRHLDTQGAVYSPVQFIGAWTLTERDALRALIVEHDGAPVPATHNTWYCTRVIPGTYSARRATWDYPIGADTFDDLLARLRNYYGEEG